MPRLFIGNFSFEQQLGERKRVNLPRHLLSLNADYATVWLAVAEPGDVIFAPYSVPGDLEKVADALKMKGIRFINDLSQLKHESSMELAPWGWNHEMAEIAQSLFPDQKIPDLNNVQLMNSRHTSFLFEQSLECGHPDILELSEEMEIINKATNMVKEHGMIVLKAEYCMSGRERIICHEPDFTTQQLHWVKHRLEQGQRIYLEPWFRKKYEVSSHYHIDQNGVPRFIAMTPLLTNERGEHLGNIAGINLFNNSGEYIDEIDNHIEHAVELIAKTGYRGAVSIDSMVYNSGNKTHIRPIQDINARWSMGRIAVEFSRRFAPGQLCLWHHFRQDHTLLSPEDLQSIIRELLCEIQIRFTNYHLNKVQRTSPEKFGHEPVRFQTELLCFKQMPLDIREQHRIE